MSYEEINDQHRWDEETSRLFLEYGRYFIPEREYQMQILLKLLAPFKKNPLVLDLCCGEGILSEMILEAKPEMSIHGFDGSRVMIERTRTRLARFGERFRCSEFDLASPEWRTAEVPVSAIVSSMAIHHLTGQQKEVLFRDVFRMLADGGIFAAADIVAHQSKAGDEIAASAWDSAVLDRSMDLDGNRDAFEFFRKEGWNTFRYLDPDDIDKPSPLFHQLLWLKSAGFHRIDVHWMRGGHTVFSAEKPP